MEFKESDKNVFLAKDGIIIDDRAKNLDLFSVFNMDGDIITDIGDSIIVMGNNKINGFAKGKIINIQTCSLTVFVDSIGESNFIISDSEVSNLEAEENKINITELTFSSAADNLVNPPLSSSFTKKKFYKKCK